MINVKIPKIFIFSMKVLIPMIPIVKSPLFTAIKFITLTFYQENRFQENLFNNNLIRFISNCNFVSIL